MRIAYLGNFGPSYSTESHVAAELQTLGHEVMRIQEGQTRATEVPARAEGADIFLWTQTYGLAEQGGDREDRTQMLADLDMPTVAFHLDRWLGLERQDQLEREPFFRCDHVFTADGDMRHQEAFTAYGINHSWSPPGVYSAEATDERARAAFRSDLAFVGSWEHYGHPSWNPYRQELFAHLRDWYGGRMRFWPRARSRAIRGAALNSLYASVKILIGDSCLAPTITGEPITCYCSDRIPETTGRGGFLIHPHVEGITGRDGIFPHVPSWPLGDWDALHDLIEHYLTAATARAAAHALMVTHTRQHHTYKHRLARILEVVMADGRDDRNEDQPTVEPAAS